MSRGTGSVRACLQCGSWVSAGLACGLPSMHASLCGASQINPDRGHSPCQQCCRQGPGIHGKCQRDILSLTSLFGQRCPHWSYTQPAGITPPDTVLEDEHQTGQASPPTRKKRQTEHVSVGKGVPAHVLLARQPSRLPRRTQVHVSRSFTASFHFPSQHPAPIPPGMMCVTILTGGRRPPAPPFTSVYTTRITRRPPDTPAGGQAQ